MPRRGRSGSATRHSSKPTATTGTHGGRLRIDVVACEEPPGPSDPRRRTTADCGFQSSEIALMLTCKTLLGHIVRKVTTQSCRPSPPRTPRNHRSREALGAFRPDVGRCGCQQTLGGRQRTVADGGVTDTWRTGRGFRLNSPRGGEKSPVGREPPPKTWFAWFAWFRTATAIPATYIFTTISPPNMVYMVCLKALRARGPTFRLRGWKYIGCRRGGGQQEPWKLWEPCAPATCPGGYLHEVSKCTARASSRRAPLLEDKGFSVTGDRFTDVALKALSDSPRGCDEGGWRVREQHFAQELVLLNR
jgi:hypothetical protein